MFLSNISDKPNHIFTVSILDDIIIESLNVLVAIHKVKFDDGNYIL